LLGNSVFPNHRAEKGICEEDGTTRPELKIILVLLASIGIMFLGLWVISQEAFSFSPHWAILILSTGMGLFYCKGMQDLRAHLRNALSARRGNNTVVKCTMRLQMSTSKFDLMFPLKREQKNGLIRRTTYPRILMTEETNGL
jgi:hypothetical protein